VNILVVEDEQKVAEAICSGLEAEGYEVVHAATGEEGFYLALSRDFDMLLLDLMLPERDGLEILRSLREKDRQVPVLILTARDSVKDRVKGLDLGADDYLVKPFAFPELLARIRALLRRGRTDQVLRLKQGDLEMDLLTRRVSREEEEIHLTDREFELLEYLLRNAGHTVSREMLARDIWEEPDRLTPIDNVIDVHIARLRKKVDRPFEQPMIHTVRGVGYVLKEPAA